MAISTAAAIIGGAALSAGAGALASSSASKAQVKASEAASATDERIFQQQVALQEPFRQGGITAQNRLMTLLGLNPGTGGAGATGNTMAPPVPRADGTYPVTATQGNPQTYSNEPNVVSGNNMGYWARGPGDASVWMNWDPVAGQPFNAGATAPSVLAAQANSGPGGGGSGGLSVDPNDPDFGKYARDFSMADFEADPGYAFRMSEGMKALNNSMAARGLGVSGAGIKGALRYGQDMGSQEYTNAFNRYQVNRANQLNPLQSLMGGGQTSANTLTNAAGDLGARVSENQLQAGNARASGYVGTANALTSAISGGVNSYLGYQNSQALNSFLNNPRP